MSSEITWHDNFYGISWAYEKDRLVVSTVFEDKPEAIQIAQEIEEILPEVIITESTGVKSLNAANLTWYLINAVKELSAKLDATGSVAELEQRIHDIEQRLL